MRNEIIYFLFDFDEIVYVGRSSIDGFTSRMSGHRGDRKHPKSFNKSEIVAINITGINFYPVSPVGILENYLIELLKPKFNKTKKNSKAVLKRMYLSDLRKLTGSSESKKKIVNSLMKSNKNILDILNIKFDCTKGYEWF